MKDNPKSSARWLIVAVFAIAMAWVESAVVYYLRTMVDRIEPYQPYPLPVIGGLGTAEFVREAATLIMLLTVGILAGRNWRSRLGYAAVAFGIWDIFYYVFLKVMCGWPHSLLDWDILFLIPLPWWGPVLAPVSIAVLMILWGTLASQSEIEKPGPVFKLETLGAEFSRHCPCSLSLYGRHGACGRPGAGRLASRPAHAFQLAVVLHCAGAHGSAGPSHGPAGLVAQTSPVGCNEV